MHDTVQVWHIPLSVSEKTLGRYRQCLSPDERSRADRFRFADDKRRFTVARGSLRHLLGQRLAQPPDAIEFCYGKYGKPSLAPSTAKTVANLGTETADKTGTFHFNLSHSGEMALCVLGQSRPVGVDIEKLKSIQRLEGMAERCLTANEQRQIHSEPDPTLAFLQRWTCKEAYLKAIGVGLSQPMTEIEVTLSPPKFISIPQDCAEGWYLQPITVPPGYVAAAVVAGKVTLNHCHWQHEIKE